MGNPKQTTAMKKIAAGTKKAAAGALTLAMRARLSYPKWRLKRANMAAKRAEQSSNIRERVRALGVQQKAGRRLGRVKGKLRYGFLGKLMRNLTGNAPNFGGKRTENPRIK